MWLQIAKSLLEKKYHFLATTVNELTRKGSHYFSARTMYCHQCRTEGTSELFEDIDGVTYCTRCGGVQRDCSLVSTTFGADAPQQFVYCDRNNGNYNAAKETSLACIRTISANLRFPAAVTENATALFEQAFQNDAFRLMKLAKKEALQVACVLIASRVHGRTITVRMISNVTHVYVDDIIAMKKLMERLLNIKDERLNPVDIVEEVLGSCILAKPQFLQLCRELLELCHVTLVDTGKRPEAVVHAAAFVVWQAQQPLERQKVSFTKYTKLHKLSCAPGIGPVNKRVREVKRLLTSLAPKLPWICSTTAKRDVLFHTLDIIRFRKTLTMEAVQ